MRIHYSNLPVVNFVVSPIVNLRTPCLAGVRWRWSGSTHWWRRVRWQRPGPVGLRLRRWRIFRVDGHWPAPPTPLHKPTSLQLWSNWQRRQRPSAPEPVPTAAAPPVPTATAAAATTVTVSASPAAPSPNWFWRVVHHQFLVDSRWPQEFRRSAKWKRRRR